MGEYIRSRQPALFSSPPCDFRARLPSARVTACSLARIRSPRGKDLSAGDQSVSGTSVFPAKLLPTPRRQDPAREPVWLTSEGERPVPNTWGSLARRSQWVSDGVDAPGGIDVPR